MVRRSRILETERAKAADQAAAESVNAARFDATLKADLESSAAFNTAMTEAGAASIERTRTNAEGVQKAATAIFALYTGALTLAFSVTDRPLPLRGALPGVFLGCAIVLSVGYLAYIQPGRRTPWPKPAMATLQAQLSRTTAFLEWVSTTVLNRSHWLRTSVVALGLGVASLPLPFLSLPATLASPPSCASDQIVDTATGACLAPWPSLLPGTADDAGLRLALLTAQLKEVSTERDAARADAVTKPDDTALSLAVLGAGLVVLAGVFVFSRKPDRRADQPSAVQPPRDPTPPVPTDASG